MRTILRSITIALLLVSGFSMTISESSGENGHITFEQPSRFSGGDGSPLSPYIISNVTELQEAGSFLDSHFILTNDIDASETRFWNGEEGFIPIAFDTDKMYRIHNGPKFNGTMEGNGYTIRHLWINDTGYGDYFGIFGCIGRAGKVIGLNVEDIHIGRGDNVGSIAGENNGLIDDCHVKGTLDAKSMYVGGLVGTNHGTIRKSDAECMVSGWSYIGGLVGFNDGEIVECGSTSNVNCSNYFGGGLVGKNEGTIERCSFEGIVMGENYAAAFVGLNEGDVTNSYYCMNQTSLNGEKALSPYGIYHNHFREWIENNYSLDINKYLERIPGSDYYSISSKADLYNMIPFAIAEYKFMQTSDIDLIGSNNFNIPVFNSVEYNGNNHRIKNLVIFSPEQDNLGFFGIVGRDSIIKDLHLREVDISGSNFVGGIAGTCLGHIRTCTVKGFPSGDDYIGGLAGQLDSGSVLECSSFGYVAGSKYIGGLIGGVYNGTVKGSSSSSQVNSEEEYAGGLIGYFQPYDYWEPNEAKQVFHCHSSGKVTGINYVGGLIGGTFGNIEWSNTNSVVTGEDYVGGLVGSIDHGRIEYSYSRGSVYGKEYFTGGLVGRLDTSSIRNCYSTSNVDGKNYSGGLVGSKIHGEIEESTAHGTVNGFKSVGGLVGGNSYGHVNNSYSTGQVSGHEMVGGFIGTDSLSEIKFCYSCGSVDGNEDVGGFIGFCYHEAHEVIGCFFDEEAAGTSYSVGGDGKTTSQMKDDVTYRQPGWDLTKRWGIDKRKTRPFLKRLDYSDMITGENVEVAYTLVRYEVQYGTSIPFQGLPDIYDWALSSNAGNWLVLSSEGKLKGTPRIGTEGIHNVNITLWGLGIQFAYRSFDLRVIDPMDTLEITTDPIEIINEDEEYFIQFEAVDNGPDPKPFSWTWESNAHFLSFDNTSAVLAGIPENEDVGTYWVNISINDGIEREAWKNYTLTVKNINDDPLILYGSIPKGLVGIPFEYSFNGIDLDPTNDTLIWSLETNASFLSIDEEDGVLSGTPGEGDIGTYRVNITLSDDKGGVSSISFQFAVEEIDLGPDNFDQIQNYMCNEDEVLNISISSIFPYTDSFHPLLDIGAAINLFITQNEKNISIIPEKNWNGNETFNITASYGENEITASIRVTVIGVNDPPSGLEIIAKSRYEDEFFQILDCVNKDPDLPYGDEFSYRWSSNMSGDIGEGSKINVTLGKGFHLITLTVTDTGGLTNSTTKVIEVLYSETIKPEIEEEKESNWLLYGILGVAAFVVVIILILIILIIISAIRRKTSRQKRDNEENQEESFEDELMKIESLFEGEGIEKKEEEIDTPPEKFIEPEGEIFGDYKTHPDEYETNPENNETTSSENETINEEKSLDDNLEVEGSDKLE